MPTPTPTPIPTQVFATPFYKVQAGHISHVDNLKAYLLEHSTEQDKNPDRPQGAHSAVFESRFDFFDRTDEPVSQLKERLYLHLMSYLSSVNGFDQKALNELKFRQESWFHITKAGGYFQPHTHPQASVSMIYCVEPGDDGLEAYEQGSVLFIDPRHNASMHLDRANRHMIRPFSFNGLRFRLAKDEVCIFPSYLQHSVEPYCGAEPRITIAANFTFL